MGQHNLDRIMRPQQVAVVGASEETGTIGNALMKNLLDGAFPGEVLPVNRQYNLAFVSQSGGICSSILDLAFKDYIGFQPFCQYRFHAGCRFRGYGRLSR